MYLTLKALRLPYCWYGRGSLLIMVEASGVRHLTRGQDKTNLPHEGHALRVEVRKPVVEPLLGGPRSAGQEAARAGHRTLT